MVLYIYIYIERVNLYLDVLFTFYHIYMHQKWHNVVYIYHHPSYSLELLIACTTTIRNIILLGIDYNSMQ